MVHACCSILKSHYLFTSVVGVRQYSALRGRFQHWKKAVYNAPHIHPLEKGPDFSLIDGRPVHVTSKIQLDYKLDQLRLAKKIVQLLNDVNEMEVLHKEAETHRLLKSKHIESIRPKSKGVKPIV